MPFPISVIGSFDVETPDAPDQYVSSLKTAISDWLVENRARKVSQTAQGFSFKAGFFRWVSNWNPLFSIGSGDIEVMRQGTSIQVTYRLRFTEILIIVTSLVVFIFGPYAWSRFNLNEVETTGILMAIWFGLFGMNYFLARYRIPKALKQIARQATGGKIT